MFELQPKECSNKVLNKHPICKTIPKHNCRVNITHTEIHFIKSVAQFVEPSRKQAKSILLSSIRHITYKIQCTVITFDKLTHYSDNSIAYTTIVRFNSTLLTYERWNKNGKVIKIDLGESNLEYSSCICYEGVLVILQAVLMQVRFHVS